MFAARRVEESMSGAIRLADEGCAQEVQAIYAPIVEHSAISFEVVPPDVAEIARRMRVTLKTHPWIVCEGEGGLEGYAYGSKFRVCAAHDWSCEVSVYVASTSRGAGMGLRLYAAHSPGEMRGPRTRAGAGGGLRRGGLVHFLRCASRFRPARKAIRESSTARRVAKLSP
jgi:hypothetical protein